MKVRTRMAPSPTGEMHVGGMATLLKNYAFAKKHGGDFILRIEDTDQNRLVEGSTERILKTIKSYGLSWDEGPEVGGPHQPYFQSERLEIYQQASQQLVQSGHAYYCFCSQERLDEVNQKLREQKKPPMYDRHCRNLNESQVNEKLLEGSSYVVRLKVPDDQEVTFTDLIRGEISINSNTLNDQVLLKSDGFPTYHLGVVVDDHHMEITHIIRGEEWISSTPKHLLLYQAFGWKPPVFAHIPVFLNPDGKGKMSKRKGDVSAQSFLDKGFLPEALLNFFMILGWATHDQREIITLDEYINEFDPADLSPKSVAFDLKKLEWINGIYIRNLSIQELASRIQPFIPDDFPREQLNQILELVSERLVKLSDFGELSSFFYREIEHDKSELLKNSDHKEVTDQLNMTIDLIDKLKWSTSEIEDAIRKLQEDNQFKKSQFFMMLRLAVTGKKQTPPLFETIHALGKDLTLKRLRQAIQIIN